MKYDTTEVKPFSSMPDRPTIDMDEARLLLVRAHAELANRAPDLPLVGDLARYIGADRGRPVLEAIRRLVRLRQAATPAAIAAAAGLSRRQVLLVLDANRHLLQWTDDNKAVECDIVKTILWRQEWNSGRYYHVQKINYGTATVLRTLDNKANEALLARLAKPYVNGGLGESWVTSEVLDTPENRAAFEAAGLRPDSEIPRDDRFWSE